MSEFKVVLPDGSAKEFSYQPTILDVAKSIGDRLAQDTLGGCFGDNPEVKDLRELIPNGETLKIITKKSDEALEVIRHSAAHVMAQAVQELWPEVKVTIGPVIKNGFYYDFDTERTFTEEDLEKIDKKISEILKRNDEVIKEVWSKDKAIEHFKSIGENFKVEIIEDLDTKEVSIYKQGEWLDLCRGPHVQRLGQIKSVKTMSVAGAYWRGDETKKQLQRIYATAFNSSKDLNKHLANLEEAKKRDHRKLGKELGLFYFHELSPGMPFFSPKGATVYKALQSYIREKYIKYDYQEVITPQIFDVELYKQSGHYDNYLDNMYFSKIDDRDFSVKPMNCPGHCLLYQQEHKSYRDLPWRVADFGRLHRYERSGALHGLTRVRTFCQDDAHVFCRLDQMQSEIKQFMTMLNEIYQELGMSNYKVFLSTRPEKRMGSDEIWDNAEGALEKALKDLDVPYSINPGDGAFYGPKIDVVFVDALDREWQLGTMQCDFNMPESFKLKYVSENNADERPVMLHRAILGSVERFIGVYLEHCAGRLPTWMAPTQVKILNITDAQADYCKKLAENLKASGVRADLDLRAEKLGFKIREAQLERASYIVVIGDKEVEKNSVAVRLPNGKTKYGFTLESFTQTLKSEIDSKSLKSLFVENIKDDEES